MTWNLYLENRILKNLKVSKFANKRDKQDIRGKGSRNVSDVRRKKNMSSITLDVKVEMLVKH